MAWTRPQQVASSAKWSCPRCYTVNAIDTQFCSDCGYAPRGGVAAAMPSPTVASPGRYMEVVPFLVFGVIALALLGLQLIR